MKIEFLFKNCKPVSNNKTTSFTKKGKYYPNKEKIVFKRIIDVQTLAQRHEIFDFETRYSPYEHCLRATIVIYIPESKLITKKGYVSQKSLDLANCEKVLTDSVFKRFEKIDDSAICYLNMEKRTSLDNTYRIYYCLEIVDLSGI